MPHVFNEDVKIYYEVTGKGLPILLYHGAFQRIESWYDSGFVDAFKDNYRLIMMDVRGHGLSDKPHIPEAYRMKLLVNDVVEVLSDLGLEKANFLGFSSGGYVGFGAIRYAPERFTSLIIGGAQPYDEWVNSWRPVWLKTFEKGEEAVRDTSVKVWGGLLSERMVRLYRENDVEAIYAWMSLDEPLGLDAELPVTKLPCLLFSGDRDGYGWIGAAERIQVIPRGRYVRLDGAGNHFESFYRPALLKLAVDDFLDGLSEDH